ncbi:hypothetical protein OHR68_43335 [Spirillospora sp. NBC_00431]
MNALLAVAVVLGVLAVAFGVFAAIAFFAPWDTEVWQGGEPQHPDDCAENGWSI